jgi:hypothetical protein
VAVPSAFVDPRIAGAIYVTVALLWLIPDPRIERMLEAHEHTNAQTRTQTHARGSGGT